MGKMQAFVRVDAQNDRIELQEVPIPELDKDEVLVKVQAFGVGIHDRYFIPANVRFPYPIGTEAAGIITKTGGEVSDFQAGDRIILSSSLQPKGGCWAQYVAVSSDMLIPLPDTLDFILGAAIPVAGKTAVECMQALGLKEGETLFVAGASGAIGTLIIQMAKNQGIRVIGSASSKNHKYMLSLGAEKAVDYSTPDWKGHVKRWIPGGTDAALAIQPGTGKDSMDVVKDGGKVITVSGDRVGPERSITVQQFQHQLDIRHTIRNLADDISRGKIRLEIERIYPFKQALEALTKTETRHARGKLVVAVAGS
ncbi:NADP-dependent oxidoreductase [Bhargavaea beijingensis]|uniref:NADPH:quinone reductase n=2 Tax=Bhargavaea beijingensis TaxID=426756 RepID=A0A1G7H2Z5_9BACL|nr:NADP-dependent oxidoreductase [Bhargavaea beijingensis]MCW1927580.1 NADP-dependent oxidoreductase [Bhargavaea beijingensis]SDE94684.1 NADPH:quinone reductase [Bhargavaea beijingensis]